MSDDGTGWKSQLARLPQDIGRGVLDKQFGAGYDEAADICMSLLSGKIEGLIGKISEGESLSDREQFLLSSLHKLRTEMDDALHAFFDDPNTD